MSKFKEKKGGVLPSDVLLGISGASSIAAGVGALTGVGLLATAPLGAISGISLGASKILKAFGKGFSKSDLKMRLLTMSFQN